MFGLFTLTREGVFKSLVVTEGSAQPRYLPLLLRESGGQALGRPLLLRRN
jgi:hypothetical protein